MSCGACGRVLDDGECGWLDARDRPHECSAAACNDDDDAPTARGTSAAQKIDVDIFTARPNLKRELDRVVERLDLPASLRETAAAILATNASFINGRAYSVLAAAALYAAALRDRFARRFDEFVAASGASKREVMRCVRMLHRYDRGPGARAPEYVASMAALAGIDRREVKKAVQIARAFGERTASMRSPVIIAAAALGIAAAATSGGEVALRKSARAMGVSVSSFRLGVLEMGGKIRLPTRRRDV